MWILLALIITAPSWAFPVLHFIKPDSSFTQITTLDACTTFSTTVDMVKCNPALFPYQADQGLRMGGATITDGESVNVGQKLILDPIKQDFLRDLFQKRAFNSWAANSSIELRTPKFYMSYDPLLINADIFVFNPASPEVSMSLVKSNRLKVTSGWEVLRNDTLRFSIGGTAYYYRNQYFRDSFFLSDLATKKADQLIDFKKKNGVAADLGGALKFENRFLPKVSFVVKNLNSSLQNKDQDITSENQLRTILTYETYSRLGFGYDYKNSWGIINGEINLPFRDVYRELYTEYISGSVGYSLSRFSTQVSYSKYQSVLGLNFGSKIATIGIFYGKSRPLGDFSTQTENVSGVRFEVSL